MTQRQAYLRDRPALAVKLVSSAELGRCYYGSTFEITSTCKLTSAQLLALREGGFLGHGQEWRVVSQHDGSEAPAGEDLVECVALDERGRFLGPAVHPITGAPVEPMRLPYWVYSIESRIDSSD